MGNQIEQIHTPSAPQSLLEELAAYYVIVEAEDMPEDPPTPLEMRIADWRHIPESHQPVFRWTMRDEDGIAGSAVVVYDLKQNLQNGFGRVHVHPEKRGRGYARALATAAFDQLESAGRTRFDTWIKDDEPAVTLAENLGLKPVYAEKRSRLSIANLDRDLMRSWIDRAPERASDYELMYLTLPLPDELVEKFCDLALIMNTAPREDYEADDEVLTPEAWREIESTVLDSKSQLHNFTAVHKPSGEFAGYTQIKTQDLQPDLAWQWETGVDPAHRNKGLGRWLKAAMIERIISEYPAVERVDTFNAGSNEPMLNINIAMGFEPIHLSHAWQGDLATARERLRA